MKHLTRKLTRAFLLPILLGATLTFCDKPFTAKAQQVRTDLKETPAALLARFALEMTSHISSSKPGVAKKFLIETPFREQQVSAEPGVAVRILIESEALRAAPDRWDEFELALSWRNPRRSAGTVEDGPLNIVVSNFRSIKKGLNPPYFGMHLHSFEDAIARPIVADIQKLLLRTAKDMAIQSLSATEDAVRLIEAIETDRRGDLDTLLSSGSDPNQRSPRGSTPLGVALERKDLESVLILLKYKADPNFPQTRWGNGALSPEAPLQALIGTTTGGSGDCVSDVRLMVQIATALLSKQANVEGEPSGIWSSPLSQAAHIGPCSPVPLLMLLKDKGADVNAISVDLGLITPLHTAITYGTIEAVLWLLDNGAKLDSVDQRGDSPLFRAIDRDVNTMHGHPWCRGDTDNDKTAIFRLLIDRKADLTARNAHNLDPVEHIKYRMRTSTNPNCFKRMLRHADPNDRPSVSILPN